MPKGVFGRQKGEKLVDREVVRARIKEILKDGEYFSVRSLSRATGHSCRVVSEVLHGMEKKGEISVCTKS